MRIVENAASAAAIMAPTVATGRPRTPGDRRFKLSHLVILVTLAALAIITWFWLSRPSPIEVVTAWGLPGVWQGDCKAPLQVDNPRYRYSIEGGKILLRRDFGREMKDTSVISDADVTPAGELHYVVHFVQLGESRQDRVSRQNVLAKSADGRIRTVSNKDTGTGMETVVAGKRSADGKPTPWMTRCTPE